MTWSRDSLATTEGAALAGPTRTDAGQGRAVVFDIGPAAPRRQRTPGERSGFV